MGSYLSRSSLFYKLKNKTGFVKSVLFIPFFLLIFALIPDKLFAISYVWNGATSTAWATTTNWTPNGNPGSAVGDIVSIPAVGTQPTLSITPANALTSLTFTGAASTLTITAVTLTVTGAVTLNNLAATSTTCTIAGTGTLSCGSVGVGSGVSPTTGITAIMVTTIALITSNGEITVTSNKVNGSKFVNSTFTHTSGIVAASGITIVNSGSPVSTYQMGNSSPTLNLSGAVPLTLAGTGTNIFTFNGTGATVNYNGNAQTVGAYTYTNLTLSGSGTKTITSVTTITGNLSLIGTVSATTTANLTIGGDLDIGSGTTFAIGTNFTLGVTGTSSITGTLTLAGTGAKTFTGNVTININAVWDEIGVASYFFGGSLTNNATTFTASTGTHTFSGAAQTLSGSTTTTIASVAVTGTYTNNGTLTVGTALSGAGTLTNASILNIGGTTSITTLTNSGTIDKSGTGTITTTLANFSNTGTINISGSGTITGITNNTGGIVNHSGSGTITSFNNATATSTLNISTTPSVPTFTTLTVSAAGNTVNYTGTGTQTVKAVSYENLILSGSGAKSLLTGTAVLGEMSVAPTGSATASVGAGLNLIVNSLLLAGVSQASGTYGSTSSAASFQNNTYFAATTGILSVNMPIVSTAAGGDWATTTTWVGSVVPIATQQVVIATTGAGAVTTAATYTCAGLAINSGAILTLKRNFTVNGTTSISGTINFGSTNTTVRVMTFNDSVTLNSGAVWDETNGGANTVLNTYFFSNNFTNDATTFTSLAGLHTFSGTGMLLSGGTTTSIANVAVTGTYTNSGTLTVGTALTGVGTLINGNGASGALNIGGTATITALTASAANNAVNYTGGAQTVHVPTSGIYHHLTFSGSGAKTLDVGITTINGNFTMAGTATATGLVGLTIGGIVTLGAGTTFTAGAFSHYVAGNWINNGGTFTNTGSTIIFNGSVAQSIICGGSSFNNFTITNTGGTCTASINDINIAGTFTTNANTTLDMGTNALIVNTVAHSGTLKTQNTSATPITISKTWGGLVQYNSAAAQTIVDGSYNNLNGTGGDRTLSSTGTIFIAGTFTVGAGTYTVTSSTVDFNGTAAQNIPAFNFNNLTISGNKGGGAMTLINGGTIGVAAVFSVTATNTSYIVTGNTFDYNGSGIQTVIAPFDYNNLVISNAGVKSILTATTVNCQTITINGTATLDIVGTGLFNILG